VTRKLLWCLCAFSAASMQLLIAKYKQLDFLWAGGLDIGTQLAGSKARLDFDRDSVANEK
jgi:hypothetical protein